MSSFDDLRVKVHTILCFHNGSGKGTIPISQIARDMFEMFDVANFYDVVAELEEGCTVSHFLQTIGCRLFDYANVYTVVADAENEGVQRVVKLMRDTPGSKSGYQLQNKQFGNNSFSQKPSIFETATSSKIQALLPNPPRSFTSYKPNFNNQFRQVFPFATPMFRQQGPTLTSLPNQTSTSAASAVSFGVGDLTYEAVSGFVTYTGQYDSPRKFAPNSFGSRLQRTSRFPPPVAVVPAVNPKVLPSLNSATQQVPILTNGVTHGSENRPNSQNGMMPNGTNQPSGIVQGSNAFSSTETPIIRRFTKPIPQPVVSVANSDAPSTQSFTSSFRNNRESVPSQYVAQNTRLLPERKFTSPTSTFQSQKRQISKTMVESEMQPREVVVQQRFTRPIPEHQKSVTSPPAPKQPLFPPGRDFLRTAFKSQLRETQPSRRFTNPLPNDHVAQPPVFQPGVASNASISTGQPNRLGRNLKDERIASSSSTAPLGDETSDTVKNLESLTLGGISRRFTRPLPDAGRSMFPPGIELKPKTPEFFQNAASYSVEDELKSPVPVASLNIPPSRRFTSPIAVDQEFVTPRPSIQQPLFPLGRDLSCPELQAQLNGTQTSVTMAESGVQQRRFTSPIAVDQEFVTPRPSINQPLFPLGRDLSHPELQAQLNGTQTSVTMAESGVQPTRELDLQRRFTTTQEPTQQNVCNRCFRSPINFTDSSNSNVNLPRPIPIRPCFPVGRDLIDRYLQMPTNNK